MEMKNKYFRIVNFNMCRKRGGLEGEREMGEREGGRTGRDSDQRRRIGVGEGSIIFYLYSIDINFISVREIKINFITMEDKKHGVGYISA